MSIIQNTHIKILVFTECLSKIITMSPEVTKVSNPVNFYFSIRFMELKNTNNLFLINLNVLIKSIFLF